MKKTRRNLSTMIAVGLVLGGIAPFAAAGTIDFETADDFTTPLLNGEHVEVTGKFGSLFNLETTGNNLGASIYDSTPGLNPHDPDLQVGSGNILILQSKNQPNKFDGTDIFTKPNDANEGGAFIFDFTPAGGNLRLDAIDLIDLDCDGGAKIILEDSNGLKRVIELPGHFTGDVNHGQIGFATIDLLSGNPTKSPHTAGMFTSVLTTEGFNINDIVSLRVKLFGSGGIDNIQYAIVPLPPALMLGVAGLGGAIILRRRRK